MPDCWTSSTTSQTGPATYRSSCWPSHGRSSRNRGRAGAPAATAPPSRSIHWMPPRWTAWSRPSCPGCPRRRGNYGSTQTPLRQVAYDTLSRRDRKARHLPVAAPLRAPFAGDGDEVIDVVARHYQDALAAVPGDPDTEEIRAEAIAALVR